MSAFQIRERENDRGAQKRATHPLEESGTQLLVFFLEPLDFFMLRFLVALKQIDVGLVLFFYKM